jgi:general secretion pathway protein D
VTSFTYQDVGIKIDVEPRVHHNKEVTLKLIIEVSQIAGEIPVEGQTPQPIIGTRTISSEIRLKDGETNLLAGLYRRDKNSTKTTIPFLGEIPVLGALFSRRDMDDTSTDLVLTLTPHIVRIPDITEADLEPVYVGTDSNISFQGSPRIESPGRAGPFDFQRREPPGPRPTPAPSTAPPAQNIVPGGLPSDPFRPPAPTPVPRQSVPPQGEVRPPGAASTASGVEKETSGTRLDFDPSALAFGPGEDRIVLVRATGESLPAGSLSIRYDPEVIEVVAVRPILSEAGVADTRIEPGRVVLDLPSATSLGGTRAVAEIVVRGVGTGRASLSLEAVASGENLASTPAVVEVR